MGVAVAGVVLVFGGRLCLVRSPDGQAGPRAAAHRWDRGLHRRAGAGRDRPAPVGRGPSRPPAAVRHRRRRRVARTGASCRGRSAAAGNPRLDRTKRDHHPRQRRRDRCLGARQRHPFVAGGDCVVSYAAGDHRAGARAAGGGTLSLPVVPQERADHAAVPLRLVAEEYLKFLATTAGLSAVLPEREPPPAHAGHAG